MKSLLHLICLVSLSVLPFMEAYTQDPTISHAAIGHSQAEVKTAANQRVIVTAPAAALLGTRSTALPLMGILLLGIGLFLANSRRYSERQRRLFYLLMRGNTSPGWSKALCTLSLALGLVFFGDLHSLQAQVTGSVFRDFDGDGTKDANEPLISGVTVNAYNTANTLCGSTSTAGGTAPNYSITGTCSGAVRVEFVLPASGFCVNSGVDYSSFAGSANGTSVQFATSNSTGVDFALQNPADYSQGTTGVSAFVPCYVNGDPLAAGGNAGPMDWYVGFNYTNTGTTTPEKKMDGTVIGAVWGVTYSKQAQKTFAAAFIKRHVGLGQNGSGAIYIMTETATSFTPTLFFDMDDNPFNTAANPSTRTRALSSSYGDGISYTLNANRDEATYSGGIDPLSGLPEGLGVVGTNTQRGLTGNRTSPSYDPAALDQVGKVGLGDIDISADGKFLFVTNLYQRKIFRLELDNAANPTSVVAVTALNFPTTTCPNGVLRPFALKFERGKLYMGCMCTAENSAGVDSDLSAKVYVYDNATAAATLNATPVLDIALDFQKGDPGSNANLPASANFNHKWTKNANVLIPIDGTPSSAQWAYPQPVLSDIEFTSNGDMMLGFFDRTGHQWGSFNRRYLGDRGSGNNPLNGIYSAGDILIAGLNCTTGAFALENNGSFASANGTTFTSGTANGEGPGGSEFFKGENYNGHNETAQGGLGAIKGQSEVMTISMDPLALNTGGVIRLSTVNGAKNAAYQLYSGVGTGNGLFGKAQGLGDVEFSSELPPLEIGNRVWMDTDNDGIQDADEMGISSVPVKLYQGTTQVGATTTDANGTYYFNNSNVNLNGATGILPSTAYVIRVDAADFPSGKSVSAQVNIGGAGQPDVRDNDATLNGGNAEIAVTTGKYGENNHTLDIAFSAASCTAPTATAASTNPTCTGNTANSNGTITISGFSAGQRYQYSAGATFNSGAATPASITAIPMGGVIVSNLANTTSDYTVRIYDATDDNCYVDRVVSITAVVCFSCTAPSGIMTTQVAATCTGTTSNNNGTISLAAVTNGTHYGVSTLSAGSYNGPAFASATAIPGTLPAVVQSSVPNSGGSYIIRVFNGAADCFTDVSVLVTAVTCNCSPIPCGTTTVVKN